MLINVTNLRSFWMVARTGSFHAAAEALSVSQPALTRQVKELEATYGVQLLTRTSKGSMPTAIGEKLLEKAEDVFASLAKADAVLSDRHADPIRIHSVSHGNLSRIVKQVRQLFPIAQVDITCAPSLDVEEALISGTCDLGLLTLDGEEHGDLDTHLVGEFPLLCAIGRNHRLHDKATVSVHEIASERIVAGTPRTQTRRTFERKMMQFGIKPNIVLEIDCFQTIRSLAEDLSVVGIVSDSGFDTPPHDAYRRFMEPEMTVPVYLAAKKTRVENSLVDLAYRTSAVSSASTVNSVH